MNMKNYLLSALLLLVTPVAQAQFTLDWSDLFSHTNAANFSCEGRYIFNDAVGNTYVIADATSNVDDQGNFTSNTYYYVVLRKYDASGNFIIQKEVDVQGHLVNGFSSKSVFGAAIDSSGNLFVGYNIYDNFNGYEIRYSKFDSYLAMQWTQKYVHPDKETGVAMAIDASANAFILCESENSGNKTYRILKTDAINQELNVHFSYDMNTDFLNDLIIDVNGNSYVTGYRLVGGFKNILTSSVSQSGMLRWKYISNTGSPNRDDYGTKLMMGSDAFLYVVGSSDRSPNSTSNFDISLFKHNPLSGKRIWERYEHYDINDRGLYLLNYDINHFFIAGTSDNIIYVARIRKSDGGVSGKIAYAPKPDEPYTSLLGASLNGFMMSPNNRFYVAGTMNANSVSGQFSAGFLTKLNFITGTRIGFRILVEHRLDGTNATSYASGGMSLDLVNNKVMWLREEITDFPTHQFEFLELRALSAVTSIRLGNEDEGILTAVYPNPSNGELFVSSYENIQTVEVYAVSGALVKTVNAESATLYNLDLSGLHKGLYIIKVIYSDQSSEIHKVNLY